MLLCDEGVRADKHVCVKCFKDELNSESGGLKQKERAREGEKKREMALQKWMLTSVVLRVAVGTSSFPDAQ